jgi:hypothetical protein
LSRFVPVEDPTRHPKRRLAVFGVRVRPCCGRCLCQPNARAAVSCGSAVSLCWPPVLVWAGPEIVETGTIPDLQWIGTESGDNPRTTSSLDTHNCGGGKTWCPNECNVSSHKPNWFWHPGQSPAAMDPRLVAHLLRQPLHGLRVCRRGIRSGDAGRLLRQRCDDLAGRAAHELLPDQPFRDLRHPVCQDAVAVVVRCAVMVMLSAVSCSLAAMPAVGQLGSAMPASQFR